MQRISLKNDELEGANSVYLFDTPAETALVDTGSETCEPALRTALERRELSIADVDTILLTHWHPDHAGLAKTIQEASGATVYIHELDAPLGSGDTEAWDRFTECYQSRLESWGVPEPKRRQLFVHEPSTSGAEIELPALASVTTIEDGDAIRIGDQVLTVRHTPGHTAGSVCFVHERTSSDGSSDQEVITGDTLLPNYTPNVGGTDVRLENPLGQYLVSLRSLAEADYVRGWPGHRGPIREPAARARETISHHERRAGRILQLLDRIGPADVWTICTELFGTLKEFHVLIGAGEAYAHLAHLQHQGDVEYVDGTYRLTDAVKTELGPTVDTWPLANAERKSSGGR